MKFKTLGTIVAAVALIGSLFFVQADDKKVGINLRPPGDPLKGAWYGEHLDRHWLDEATRLPLQILIIAGFVTLADLILQYHYFELHQRIGLFVALIVTNCTLLGRAELFASRQPVALAAFDGLMMGLGFMTVLLVMGCFREILGHGTLFADLHLLIGSPDIMIRLMDSGFLLAVLPPGAFLTLGCLIALKNYLDQKLWTHERGKTLSDSVTPEG